MIYCQILSEKLDSSRAVSEVESPDAGAIASFIGTARNSSTQRSESLVTRLEYEGYLPMAEKEMRIICEEAVASFALTAIALYHRVGILDIGDAAVVIAVSAAHRAAAFYGCRFIIEELKKRVPIFKKEVFADGSEWVNARP